MGKAAVQMIDGVPTYNLFIGGEWVPSSRNEATASHNPAKIVLMGPESCAARWLSVTIRGTPGGTPSARHTSRICFIRPGSEYRVFHVISQGSNG